MPVMPPERRPKRTVDDYENRSARKEVTEEFDSLETRIAEVKPPQKQKLIPDRGMRDPRRYGNHNGF